jgi:glycosyltransferase involved in cell wall biosynthesis
MLLSIIIAVYNDRDGLSNLLKSIRIQLINFEARQWEIIIIDDGSDVDYSDIINDDLLPIRFFKQENGRQGKARNYGMQFACGKFLWFLDADDDIPDLSLACVVDAISKNQDKDILFFNANYDGTVLKSSSHSCTKLFLIEQLSLNKFTVAPWNKVYNKEFLFTNMILFPENVKYEDLYFSILSVYKSNKIMYFDIAIYNYYKNLGSTTNSHDKSIVDIFTVIHLLMNKLFDIEYFNLFINKIIFVHGVKYTIKRLIESRDMSLVFYVLKDSEFRYVINKTNLKHLSFFEKLIVKSILVLSSVTKKIL